MKKTIITALIAVATALAFSCTKEEVEEPEDTFKLPGTSWAFDMNATLMGTSVVVNDTLNILDEQSLERRFRFSSVASNVYRQLTSGYIWNDTTLTLLDTVGQPTNMVLTYRESDSVFFRSTESDPEMAQVFQMMGVSEVIYKRIK